MNTPEKIASVYLRLNGFFTLNNFTHLPEKGQSMESDILAIRCPSSEEKVNGEKLQIDENFFTSCKLNKGEVIGLLVEVKGDRKKTPFDPLFSIKDAELGNSLNKSIISEDLKDAFKTNRFSLTNNASVTKKKEDEWEIKENKKNFIIRKKDETLYIYQQWMKEKTEKKIEYAKSFFGNFQDRVYLCAVSGLHDEHPYPLCAASDLSNNPLIKIGIGYIAQKVKDIIEERENTCKGKKINSWRLNDELLSDLIYLKKIGLLSAEKKK